LPTMTRLPNTWGAMAMPTPVEPRPSRWANASSAGNCAMVSVGTSAPNPATSTSHRGLPVRASRATRRASTVPTNTRPAAVLVAPQFTAGAAVEGDYVAVGQRQVHDPIDHDGRRLETGRHAAVPGPRRCELS